MFIKNLYESWNTNRSRKMTNFTMLGSKEKYMVLSQKKEPFSIKIIVKFEEIHA